MDLEKLKEQFNHIAEKYDSHRKCFIPCFDDFYTRSNSNYTLIDISKLGVKVGKPCAHASPGGN